MRTKRSISVHTKEAGNYDQQIKEYNNFVHDVLFGMLFEYVKPKQKLLDVGIGTGLSSVQFAKLGLSIYGIDASKEMLDMCKAKSFAKQLKLYDITRDKIPFGDKFFHHATAIGVLNFFPSLESVFNDIKRVLKKNGVFAFTILPNLDFNSTNKKKTPHFTKHPTPWGVAIYKHSADYLSSLLKKNSFELLKEQMLVVKTGDDESPDMLLSLIIVKSI